MVDVQGVRRREEIRERYVFEMLPAEEVVVSCRM